ncbi:4472_t:CDS:2 [Dentiscutata erythropus]|uniref:4472_t:CDS:1 n=1 Tax=Dentiscutata erythropus TaxID=1348616 RepID=A0A9N9GTB8_9GLOM|nr:4472_t:CDS:2 [Dentiscutata erythropus]
MPSPGRHFKEISMPIVFLPTNYNYTSVYRNYTQTYKDKYGDVRVISKSTFTNIWKALMPSFQFMSSKSDLCETCEMMKMDIQYATQHKKKLELTKDYLAHLNHAQEEHDYYNKNITTAIEDGKHNPNGVESQQVGSLYFKSPRKAHLFGVCNTGNFPNIQQINYVIDEAEIPDDGKQGKGINCILSLCYLSGEGYQYYNFKAYFQTFKKLPNIQKYYHFYFTSQYLEIVSYKNNLEESYKTFTMRSFFFDANNLPSTLNVKPLTFKQQEELYKEIAPHVDLPFRDITCLKPEAKLEER